MGILGNLASFAILHTLKLIFDITLDSKDEAKTNRNPFNFESISLKKKKGDLNSTHTKLRCSSPLFPQKSQSEFAGLESFSGKQH